MTAVQYAFGVALLCAMAASLSIAAVAVRRVLLPEWSHAPARVAEAVIGLAAMILVSVVLGSVDSFSRWPVVIGCVVVASVAVLLCRHRTPRTHQPTAFLDDPPRPGTASTAAAALAVGLMVIPWLDGTRRALRYGMSDYDTLSYHMPFAARFVQDASVTGLHYMGNAPVSFYPMNSELVHAIGILLFDHDVLSPLLNLAWLGLALLSAWCIGRPLGVGPATMTAAALVASLPVVVQADAGTAKNDIVALALLLAAVALLVNARGRRAALVLAALAGGLAVGTRLNLWASVIPLVVVAVGAAQARRRVLAAWCGCAVAAGGALWYVRNLIEVGNPLPWLRVEIAGVVNLPATTPPTDCGLTSVAHYVTDPAFVVAHLLPQLRALGPTWWVVLYVLCLTLVGVVGALLPGASATCKVLALLALISGLAYLLTPATAGGVLARCFSFNTRFAAPALVLGLVAVPLVLARWRVRPLTGVLVIAIPVAVMVYSRVNAGWLLTAAIVAAGVTGLALGAWRPVPRAALVAGLVFICLGGALAGWHQQDDYLRRSYVHRLTEEPIDEIAAALRGVSHARVAVAGFRETYPFYGSDLTNRVILPARVTGARFADYSTCRAWLQALGRGRFEYVVTARQGERDAPTAGWTRLYGGVREVLAARPGALRQGKPWRWRLFRLPTHAPPTPEAACPAASPRGG